MALQRHQFLMSGTERNRTVSHQTTVDDVTWLHYTLTPHTHTHTHTYTQKRIHTHIDTHTYTQTHIYTQVLMRGWCYLADTSSFLPFLPSSYLQHICLTIYNGPTCALPNSIFTNLSQTLEDVPTRRTVFLNHTHVQQHTLTSCHSSEKRQSVLV